jgi:hypothetical protein
LYIDSNALCTNGNQIKPQSQALDDACELNMRNLKTADIQNNPALTTHLLLWLFHFALRRLAYTALRNLGNAVAVLSYFNPVVVVLRADKERAISSPSCTLTKEQERGA